MPGEFLKQQGVFDLNNDQHNENLYYVSKFISGTPGPTGIYEDRAIREQDLKSMLGGGENLFNSNLTLDQDRDQDLNSFILSFLNGKQLKWHNNVDPGLGNSSFEFQGAGIFPFDRNFDFKDGLGFSSLNISGNGIITHGNLVFSNDYACNINGNIGASGGIYVTRSGSGITISSSGGSYNEASGQSTAGWFGNTTGAIGVWGRDNSGIGVKAESSAGLAILTDGKAKSINLPLGNAGINPGEWYLDSAVNAAANGDLVIVIKQ